MKLNDLIFSDGKILSYEQIDTDVLVIFKDYRGTKLEIYFHNISELFNNDGVGYSIDQEKITRSGNKQKIELIDDELDIMFSLNFDKVDISFID